MFADRMTQEGTGSREEKVRVTSDRLPYGLKLGVTAYWIEDGEEYWGGDFEHCKIEDLLDNAKILRKLFKQHSKQFESNKPWSCSKDYDRDVYLWCEKIVEKNTPAQVAAIKICERSLTAWKKYDPRYKDRRSFGETCSNTLSSTVRTPQPEGRKIVVLKDSKPTTLLHGCLHSWELKRQEELFFLVCFWCHARIKAWKRLPKVFSNVLDAAAKLEPRVSEADLRTAVSSLNLPSRSRGERGRVWDTYATLRILLSLKSGGPRGNLAVKSKALTKLIEVAMYPDRLKTMAVSSRKRYEFIIDAIKKLPARLSRVSSS